MTSFFWSSGHFGWFFFDSVVFSALSLLVTDIIWRKVRVSSRKLLPLALLAWAAGVGALIALWYV